MRLWDWIRALLPRRPRTRDEPGDLASISRSRGDIGMTASEVIFAAVNRIASTLASMPLHLYNGQEVMADHPLERMLSYAPNEYLSGYQWRMAMQGAVGAEGNAYALIVPSEDGTRPAALDVLKPSLVTPYIDRASRELWYMIYDEVARMQYWVPSTRMIALHFLGTGGILGLRPMDILRGTLEYDHRIKEFSLEQLSNVNNAVMLTVPSTGMLQEDKDRLIAQFMTRYKQSGRSVVVLDGGITANSMTRSPVDAKVLDVERITKNRVATVYGIPPHMLGDYTDTSYSTAEQSMQEFLQLTMLGWVSQWEAELDRRLLTWEMIRQGFHFRFDMTALIRADTATMANKHNLAIRGGWMTPNEARRADGLSDRPEGDELLCARDLLPLKLVKEGATIETKPAAAGKGG